METDTGLTCYQEQSRVILEQELSTSRILSLGQKKRFQEAQECDTNLPGGMRREESQSYPEDLLVNAIPSSSISED